jgi:hypothetical protein
LIAYDILADSQEAYYRFVTTEFVPTLRNLDVYILDVQHVVWGKYPIRQMEFVAESVEIMQIALNDPKFKELEKRLRDFTQNYSRRVIRYHEGFQI